MNIQEVAAKVDDGELSFFSFFLERVEEEEKESSKLTPKSSLSFKKLLKTKTGVRQLVRAEKTQRAGRLVLCIMLLAAMVLFMLLIIVLRAIF